MYHTHLENCRKESVELHKRCSRISFLRFITAAAAVIFFCLGYAQRLPAAAAAILFFLLVRRNHVLKDRLDDLSHYESVILDYEARLDNGWKRFSENGTRYEDGAPIYAADLDIIGKNSLYQYICTAGTVLGQDRLAGWLLQPDEDIASMRLRQQAVEELAHKPEFTLHFEASARPLKAQDYAVSQKNLHAFFDAAKQNTESFALLQPAIRIFPALTLTFFGLYLCGIAQDRMLSCFLTAAMLQLAASFLAHRTHTALLAPVYKMNQTIAPYRTLLEQLAEESFTGPYLRQLQQTLFQNSKQNNRQTNKHKQTGATQTSEAVSAFRKLHSIADLVVLRHNVYASLLLNSLFCYDFHCAQRYRKWIAEYGHLLQPWLETIGCMEALISLGTIGRTRQTHTLPQLSDSSKPVISGTDLRHPLLREENAIGNDFEPTHRTCIITGSNMSGKTTFMRTIGVNLVLAYAGGFCTATEFSASYMKICTSMRTTDNVNEGISSFYAELLRMQKIVEAGRLQRPMIALIDEIYKGTNSKDRILAAQETIKKLSKPFILTILTTHDLALCDLEHDHDVNVQNYYFTEQYAENQILFDYKIRHGRCETSNARYLLHMAGIL